MWRKKTIIENLQVTGYASEGKSLGKVDGKVIFVEGAVPGDVVDVLLTKNKKDWGEGKAIEFREHSKDRIKAFCKHFGICGGCKWQMLPYEKQLQYKEQEAEQVLKRIGKTKIPPLLPIIGSDETIYYRNKLEFTFSDKKFLTREEIETLPAGNWGSALGYHAPGIFDKVIDISECWLMDPVNNIIRNTARAYAQEYELPYYNIKGHTGFLRNIIVRNSTPGELMVNLVFGYRDEEQIKKFADHLLEKIPSISTLLYTINPKWNDSINDLQPEIYSGKGFIIEKLGEYRFRISPKSFFQTNTRQAEKLYNVVKNFSSLTGNETVYDLYCGTGSIGIYLSKDAKKIIGIDIVEESIRDAKENAAMNNISHAEFFKGDVTGICNDEFISNHGKADVVITDPPRAGMHENLVKKLLEMAPPKIVYVSCNVATQARDICLLSEKYRVEKIQPLDMFPHTHHIECLALLELKK